MGGVGDGGGLERRGGEVGFVVDLRLGGEYDFVVVAASVVVDHYGTIRVRLAT